MAGLSPLSTLLELECTQAEPAAAQPQQEPRSGRKGRERCRRGADGAAAGRQRGSRRLRRLINELELRRAGGGFGEADDLKELFSVRWRGGFGDLFGSGRDRWEAFVCLGEEEQCKWLEAGRKNGPKRGKGRTVEPYSRVDGRIRNTLKRKGFLVPVVRRVEEKVRGIGPGEMVALILGDSISRLAAHGVAQFYGMKHHSENRENGKRVTIIQARTCGFEKLPQTRLADLIAA